MILRPYQEAAVQAVYDYLRSANGNPCVVAPTGCGKSVLIGQIVKDACQLWNGRVFMVTHVRELVAQNADKVRKLCPELEVGIHSAGLKRRDLHAPVICASIQSVYKRAFDFDPFDLILIDEAHLLSGNDDSMYGRFLTDARTMNPHVRLVGFTATPYRLDSGLIYGDGRIFDEVCFDIGVRELIRDGYLSPLRSKAGVTKVDTSQLHIRGGEFVAGEVESLMDEEAIVTAACQEVVEQTAGRRSVLIFASGVRHGRHIASILKTEHGVECGFVSGETPLDERDRILSRFKSGELKYLSNCAVLTTGFDAPNIDCIALMRPTMSPGLLVQMIGRGLRLYPGKRECLILDYGGNIERHGPIDQVKVRVDTKDRDGGAPPAKSCPECRLLMAAAFTICPECGYEFPAPDRKRHEAKASSAGVLSGQITDTEYEVGDVQYSVHTKFGADDDAPKSMRVDYRVFLDRWISEWVCVEHQGYARSKAESWWHRRSPDPVPDTAERAVELAQAGALSQTHKITVRNITGDRFDRIIDYELGPAPEAAEYPGPSDIDDDEIPF